MSGRRKLLALVGLIAVALAAALFLALRPSNGDAGANVAEFAKSIDNTNGHTPSVPKGKLALGRIGIKKDGR